jgi:hypothetical protein
LRPVNPADTSTPINDSQELAPDSFVKRVLAEFGLQWTNLAVFSGVALAALGLEAYINPGLWMAVAMASFTLVFLFRRQVTTNFPRAAAVAIVVIVVTVLAALLLLPLHHHQSVSSWMKTHRDIATVYLGALLLTPFAYLIKSYSNQETLFGGPFPTPIRDAIVAQLVDAPFYRRNQEYEVSVVSAGKHRVVLRTRLSYTLVNRTKSPQTHLIAFGSTAIAAEYLAVEIGGTSIDFNDPDYRAERGFRVPRTLGPREDLQVSITAEETFLERGSELFGAYLPATRLTFILHNLHPETETSVESLLHRKVDGERLDEWSKRFVARGVLPYSGFRLHWRPAQT